MEKKETKKLTLCDGCILMLILGVAASVFTPGITQAVEEIKLSDMVDRLQIIRSQIMLYKAHNNGLLPGQTSVGDSVKAEDFTRAMAQDNPDGSGPYLKDIFENPYVADPARRSTITCVNDADATPTGGEQTAWWFNAATGEFFACDSQFHTNY
jgi:type II secretory pathway pseudopilin PulG